ncbi:MAG: hypothetical protein HY720_24585 [Planctomycetes bacterium]|nr:hypothetical protein [Planctomycetota bacterium]
MSNDPSSQQAPFLLQHEDHRLRASVPWMLRLRWVAVFAVLVAAWLSGPITQIIPSAAPLFVIVAIMAVFNAGLHVWMKRGGQTSALALRHLTRLQIAADLLFLTALLHFAGGIENPFSLLYVCLIVMSGILLSPRESYGVAAGATVLFASLVLLEQQGVLDHYHLRCYPHGMAIVQRAPGEAEVLPNDKPHSSLQVPGFLGAFVLTAFVLCYFTGLVIRALRQSLDRMAEENAWSRTITESMNEGMVCFDGRGQMISCNSAARRLLDCGTRDPTSPCWCGTEKVNSSNVGQIVSEILAGRKGQVFHESTRGQRTLLNSFCPVVGTARERAGVVWVLVDLSEVRRLQMELVQHERSAVLAEISAFVAHDVGNLLDGTLNGLRILEQSACDAHECTKWARELRARVEQVPAVIRGLVELSRRKMLQTERIGVNDVALQALRMVSFRGQQRNVRCDVVTAEVPPVDGDPMYLTMAVVNLLVNAFDAVRPGGRIRLEVRRSPDDPGRVEIVCKDDGCGIPPTDLERVFEPFFTTKAETGGTGLGLTIARRIALEHKGDLRATSVSGRGSTFVLSLPAVEDARCEVAFSSSKTTV